VGTYSFTKAAIQDLELICDAIAIDNPDAASNLFDDIRKQCVRVAKFPLSGKGNYSTNQSNNSPTFSCTPSAKTGISNTRSRSSKISTSCFG
jgi:plasmid stabilization system protein ParE